MSGLIVHAGNDIPREKYRDAAVRAERLRAAEQIIIERNIAGIRIYNRLDVSCCLFVLGNEEGLRALQSALKTAGIATTLA